MRNCFAALLVLTSWTAIASGQAFQYANAWNNGLPPGLAAGYATGYGMPAMPGYAGYSAPQAAYGQAAYPQASYSQAPGIPMAYSANAYPSGAYEQGVYQPQVATQPDANYLAATAPCQGPDCPPGCANACCQKPCWHHSGVFGEFLYWQASGADISYGIPQDGISAAGSTTPPGTVPLGRVGILETDYEPSFRVGFNVALNCDSSVRVTYTQFQTRTNDDLSVPAPFVIQPLVMFPRTFNAGFTAQVASAASSLEMSTIDLDYRGMLFSGQCYHVNGVIGARYAELDQSFNSIYFFAPPDGTTLVASELDFAGGGIRTGLEGEYFLARQFGIAGYSKAMASLLGGQFRGRYLQANQFNGVEAATTWEDSRLVPTAELECGLTWVNRRNNFRLSAGYYFGCWANVVTTSEWINGVQGLNFFDISQDRFDTIRFDGLVARAEVTL